MKVRHVFSNLRTIIKETEHLIENNMLVGLVLWRELAKKAANCDAGGVITYCFESYAGCCYWVLDNIGVKDRM